MCALNAHQATANTISGIQAIDAHYQALAEREQCEFWIADERLYTSVKDQFSWVRLMAGDASASMPV